MFLGKPHSLLGRIPWCISSLLPGRHVDQHRRHKSKNRLQVPLRVLPPQTTIDQWTCVEVYFVLRLCRNRHRKTCGKAAWKVQKDAFWCVLKMHFAAVPQNTSQTYRKMHLFTTSMRQSRMFSVLCRKCHLKHTQKCIFSQLPCGKAACSLCFCGRAAKQNTLWRKSILLTSSLSVWQLLLPFSVRKTQELRRLDPRAVVTSSSCTSHCMHQIT